MRAGALPEMFQGREGFMELWRFDKNFIKNARQKSHIPKETLWSFLS